MFNNIRHSLFATIGAVIFTLTSVGAAVGPARAVETAPAEFAQLSMSIQANG